MRKIIPSDGYELIETGGGSVITFFKIKNKPNSRYLQDIKFTYFMNTIKMMMKRNYEYVTYNFNNLPTTTRRVFLVLVS